MSSNIAAITANATPSNVALSPKRLLLTAREAATACGKSLRTTGCMGRGRACYPAKTDQPERAGRR